MNSPLSFHQTAIEVVWTQPHGGTSTFRAEGKPADLVAWLRQLATDLERGC